MQTMMYNLAEFWPIIGELTFALSEPKQHQLAIFISAVIVAIFGGGGAAFAEEVLKVRPEVVIRSVAVFLILLSPFMAYIGVVIFKRDQTEFSLKPKKGLRYKGPGLIGLALAFLVAGIYLFSLTKV